MSNVVKVSFALENCETVEFTSSEIGVFEISNVTSNVSRYASNCIRKHMQCEMVAVELLPHANRKYASFGSVSKDTTFERLKKYPDIVLVSLTYDNRSEDEIYVPWRGDINNECQRSYLSDNGAFYILISQDKTIPEYFNLECINSGVYKHFLRVS